MCDEKLFLIIIDKFLYRGLEQNYNPIQQEFLTDERSSISTKILMLDKEIIRIVQNIERTKYNLIKAQLIFS
ncbi:hypothetical protein OAT42_05945 [Alphaproteobacteria bacterium]|nr:hypothetical protein [Alphaproteobacteria bacterium]